MTTRDQQGRFGLVVVAWLLFAAANEAQANDAVRAEAAAIGGAATSAVSTHFSSQPAADQTPGFQARPPEAELDPTSLTTSTSTLLALCQTTPSDPSCEAILKARADAIAKSQTPSLIGDPSVQSALTVRGALLGSVAAGYSGCGTDTTVTGTQHHVPQSCFAYQQRAPDISCINTLRVQITGWNCSAGTTGPYVNGAGKHVCDRYLGDNYSCRAGETLASDDVGHAICVSFTVVPPSLIPIPSVRPADAEQIIVQEEATPEIFKYWDRGCGAHEARVPAGMLAPDGDNFAIGAGTTTPATTSCMRNHSVCTDVAPATRYFDTVPVTATCWAYTNTFDCLDPPRESDCNTNQWGQCSPQGSGSCVERDPVNPASCITMRYDYSCLGTDTRRVNLTANCAGQTFTDDYGVQWSSGHAPNADLGRAVALLEAGREAGKYMTEGGGELELFKGADNRCVKKLGGLVNCCTKTGGLNLQAFSNASVIMTAVGTGGKALASTYTYDALFASDAPQWLVNGFQAVLDGGYSSVLAGAVAGDLAVDQILSSLVPGPWSMALLAIQLSGITSCPTNQQITSIKRGGNLCMDLGDYCSREFRALFFKVCLERTQSACCFNSKLAKAINVQGKAQLGISMGSAQGPNCRGFTVSDFQRLDLSRMDFTEFIADVQAQAIDAAATVGRADPMKCYYGTNGRCN
jgi:conjugal transfer mating pair stabilization protein TraN